MPDKKRIILYFTATGNSLSVARELATADTRLISIPNAIKNGASRFKADEIGIVSPVYGHMPPHIVSGFIKKAIFKANYKFAVLTYGARKCNAVEILDTILNDAGHHFDYISTIRMVDNNLQFFDMEQQRATVPDMEKPVEEILDSIIRHRKWHEPVSDDEREAHETFLKNSGLSPQNGFLTRSEIYFNITDSCIGCQSVQRYVLKEITEKQPARLKHRENVNSVLSASIIVRRRPYGSLLNHKAYFRMELKKIRRSVSETRQ